MGIYLFRVGLLLVPHRPGHRRRAGRLGVGNNRRQLRRRPPGPPPMPRNPLPAQRSWRFRAGSLAQSSATPHHSLRQHVEWHRERIAPRRSFSIKRLFPGLAHDARRTWNLAWYNVLLDGGGSLGALCSALPILLHHQFGESLIASYRFLFLGYSGFCLMVAALYLFLSPAVEIANPLPLAENRIQARP